MGTHYCPEVLGGSFNRSLKPMIDHAFRFVDVVYFDIGVRNIRSRKAVESWVNGS